MLTTLYEIHKRQFLTTGFLHQVTHQNPGGFQDISHIFIKNPGDFLKNSGGYFMKKRTNCICSNAAIIYI